jgi:hypothetical protein
MDTERLLKSSIKIAAVCLTSPATWQVSGRLYDNPFQRILVQAAALVLVEGALLLGWWKLDNDRQSETPQRVLYATLAAVSYIALWSIAIAHGEGAAGVTFRLTLGVLLGYSVFESGILAGIRLRRSQERNPNRYHAVRQAKRKSDIAVAIKQIAADEEIAVAQMDIDTTERRGKLTAKPSADVRKETPPKGSAKTTRTVKRRPSRINADTLPERIAETMAEYPDRPNKDIAKMLKISESTLYKYMPEPATNGNGHRAEGE